MDATLSTPDAGNPGPPPAPPRVPDHELLRRIGRGAYGEVWLARGVTGAYRAVKVVHRRSFDHDRPFEREFEGILQFEPISRRHDSQVDILHVGRGDGCFYYVMELADDQATGGQIHPDNYTPRTLKSDLLFQGRLPFEECVRIGVALATALEHLHAHDLVHRDVKPSNIIFVNGVPKLADIGLVAGVDATRSYVGTEGFAAPEGPGSRQADLYSLGKVLYEIATGKDRQQFPELPTQLRELPDREGLVELNTVIARACRHDPKDRYSSATAMRGDLELLQSGKSLARLRRTEERLRLVQRAGAVVAALAALVALGWFWQAEQTRTVRALSDANVRLAEENRQRLVRLGVANGVRLLDENDTAGALLWFADTLFRVTNHPAEESLHRIRIQQTLKRTPRIAHVFPHGDPVFACAFSEDGRRIVTGTESGHLRVWDSRSGLPIGKPLKVDGDGVRQTRFTRDGQRIFASSLRGHGFVTSDVLPTNTAVMIEVGTGRAIVALSGTDLVRADLSPDDRWLVTADTNHVIHLHDALDGRRIADLEGHTDLVTVFSINTNGTVLASSSQDRTVRLWRLPSGEPLGSPLHFERELGPVVLDRRGGLLATTTSGRHGAAGTVNSIIQTWDVATCARVGAPIEMQGGIAGLEFVSSGGQNLLAFTDKECWLYNPVSQESLLQPITLPRRLRAASVSPDGRRVAFAGEEGLTGIWRLESGELSFPPWLREGGLTDVHFSPDGSQLLALSPDGTATLLDAHRPQEDRSVRLNAPMGRAGLELRRRLSADRRRFLLPRGGQFSIVDLDRIEAREVPRPAVPHGGSGWFSLASDGNQWAIHYQPVPGSTTELVELWRESEHGTTRTLINLPAALPTFMQFSPDGSRLITAHNDARIRWWRTMDGSLERTLSTPDDLIVGDLFPDGRTAAAYHRRGGGFFLFDSVTNSITQIPMDPMVINKWAFHPAGDRFAPVDEERPTTRVWSRDGGVPLTAPLNHLGRLTCVDFSPDGRWLLTAGRTPVVRIWDAATGEQVRDALQLGTKPLETAQWSLDGRFIVARSDDNLVRVWDSTTGEAVTPMLPHSGYVRYAILGQDNRLITFSLPDVMRVWELDESRLPLEALADYAKLVSGRRLNANGIFLALPGDELAVLERSLRQRAPQLFQ